MIKLNQIFCRTELKSIENIGKDLKNAENLLKIEKLKSLELANAVDEYARQLNFVLQANIDVEVPEWLNQKIIPYRPIVKITDNYLIPIPPQDIIARTYGIKKIVVDNKWKELTIEERLNAIWNYVCKNIYYASEERENFQFPIVTLERKYGDCDDSSTAFVALARESGIPADMVFETMGYLKSGIIDIGHAYPIALYNRKWCVFDTTYQYSQKPSSPTIFKGSKYRSPNTGQIRGLFNDVFSGVIKDGDQI